MRCSQCEQHLSALLDGELPRALADEVQRHVAGCERCAAHRARLEQLRATLEAAPALEPSPGFDAAFARRLQDARRAARLAGDAPKRRRWLFPVFAAVAAGACAAVVALVLSRSPAPPPGADPEPIVLARNLDLLRDYDVVRNLDALENADLVQDLDQLLPGAGVRP